MIKVSVIIPVYRVEQYLPACLDSVLGQSLQELELIAIDDASPDRCGEILDEYARRDTRVHVIHLPENRQQGFGRNRGFEAAQGEYVYFLDSDDMITATALEELYETASADRLDGIFFDSQVLYETEELARSQAGYAACRKGSYGDRVYGGQELLEAFFENHEWDCYVQREFWRREFLLENGICFPEGVEHEDEYFAFAAVLQARRMRCLAKPYFIRRYRENSVMTRKPLPKDFHGYFINYCRMVELVESRGLSGPGIDRNIVHMYERMLLFYPLFAAQADPRDWFKTEQERRDFALFANTQKFQLYYRDKLEPIRDAIPEGVGLWLYGAGVVGRKACRAFESEGYRIEGFLVTSREGNPAVVLGREVRTLAEVEPREDRLAVICTANLQREMADNLERLGWHYLCYPTGR